LKPVNLGGCKTINAFVARKLNSLQQAKPGFEGIFPLMFEERENILWEESRGYRIVKTSYGEAYDSCIALSEAVAAHFAELPPDSAIGLAASNGPLFIELLWAILRAGFRPVLVNTRLGGDILLRALAGAGAHAMITDGSFYLPDGNASGIEEITPDALLSDGRRAPAGGFGSEILVMSSGTSSHIKCCGYTAEAVRAQLLDSGFVIKNVRAVKKHYEGELKLLALLPFCHIFGLGAVYLWFAFYSRTFVGLADLSPRTVQNTIKRHKVTHIFAVPLFWEKTHEAAVKEISSRGEKTLAKFEKGLSIASGLDGIPALAAAFRKKAFREVREKLFGESISFLISGGSGIKRENLEFFNGIGYHLANGYGMTETGITSFELSDNARILCTGSAGRPLPSAAYSLSPDGILLVSGSSGAAYIIENGEKREKPVPFSTGDLARIDEKTGRVFILGRSDELVIGPSGENLNPNVIEPLFDMPGVRGVCLCPVEKDGATTPVLAVSVNGYSSAETAAGIRERVMEKMSASGLNGLVGELLITGDPLIGEDEFKLNRRKIALKIASGEIKPFEFERQAFDAENSLLYGRIRAAFAAALPQIDGDIADDADFFADLGGTSFDYAALTSALGEELGISFPASAEGLSSIKEIYIYSEKAIEKLDKIS